MACFSLSPPAYLKDTATDEAEVRRATSLSPSLVSACSPADMTVFLWKRYTIRHWEVQHNHKQLSLDKMKQQHGTMGAILRHSPEKKERSHGSTGGVCSKEGLPDGPVVPAPFFLCFPANVFSSR